MKADIHPQYKEVVFQDVTSDFKFLTRSTLGSKETIKWEDGNEYPLIKVDVSSATHPLYTGQNKIMDTSGRVAKFRKRYSKQDARSTARKRAPTAATVRPTSVPAPASASIGHTSRREKECQNAL